MQFAVQLQTTLYYDSGWDFVKEHSARDRTFRIATGAFSCFSAVFYTRAVPEAQGGEICNFGSEKCGGFLVANFVSIFPQEK